MIPEQQTEYIVQCLRDSGSMYEDDARKFLAEHDDRVRTTALTEAIDGLTDCLRLGGLTQRGLVLARKRLVALRDGGALEKPRRNVRHTRIAERLRDVPGKWLPVGDYANDQSAYGIAHSIKTGMRIPAYQPAGAYEARIEQTETGARVYARYVGATAEAGDHRG
ncbi:hypothetical protein [Streptomyces scabiei]|uniref:hypothetical protein n=1 Tax=Streptomyces scabiei TaxID=1930 RepID=UPI0029A1F469|nr:hypothetical protein [Streptomyces scabiei]MDX3520774.1 hypothetical protein [Streptomyces scabiei]